MLPVRWIIDPQEKRTNDQLSSIVRLISWTPFGQVSGGKNSKRRSRGQMLNNVPRIVRSPPNPDSGDGPYLPIPFACTVTVYNVPTRHILNLGTKEAFLSLALNMS